MNNPKMKTKGKKKIKCDGCKLEKRARHIIRFKGKFLCTNCRNKRVTSRIQQSASVKLDENGRMSLEKALNKVYEINGYLSLKGHIRGFRSFPSILIGHKVKLILVK